MIIQIQRILIRRLNSESHILKVDSGNSIVFGNIITAYAPDLIGTEVLGRKMGPWYYGLSASEMANS